MQIRIRYYIFFILFALIFLFYPGDTVPLRTYVFHRDLFTKNANSVLLSLDSVPVATSSAIPVVSAESVLIADENTLSPVYEKNVNVSMLPASTTKIVTALVAYDIYRTDQILTVKQSFDEGQVMNLVQGEKITVENLLYGILVHSANDAAEVLAQNYGKTEFIKKMNEKARSISMDHSHFENPSGLHQPNHYTTATDLARAARALLRNPYLSKISATKEIIISDIDFKYFHKLSNVNELLGEIPGIGGLKTGYTLESGQNLVTRYKRHDGHEMLIVVLKSEDRFLDTRELVNWIENTIQYEKPQI